MELLKSVNVSSVNQLAIKIKLTECWKPNNVQKYPIKFDKGHAEQEVQGRQLRTSSLRQFEDHSKTKIGEESFHISTGKAWNNAPQEIKDAKSIFSAKRLIKNIVILYQSRERTVLQPIVVFFSTFISYFNSFSYQTTLGYCLF